MSSSSSSAIARASSSTTSSIVATSAFGSHVLKIDGYTRTKGLTTGVHLNSGSFRIGGHSWHLAYLPNGDNEQNAEFISFYLVLENPPVNGAPVLAKFCVALLDRAGKTVPTHTQARPVTQFASPLAYSGFSTFLKREVLEKSRYLNLKDDSFCVRCEVNVVTGFRAEDDASAAAAKAAAAACVRVPPPDLSRNFGELLRSELGADVRIRVDGEDFAAHRCVLAVRSPVFQAQLFGAMKEASLSAGGHCWLEIDDMRADVFQNLLHFIYTDTLPTKPEPQQEALIMAQHLLVAADRYGMDRLKLICEDVLCRHIDVSTAATTLALAEQHQCKGLKEACFQFLKKTPASLNAVMATDGFDHLANSCPAIIKELMSRLATAHSN